ncbi:MAG: membrane protein [marine bacterium B5-7]|nr:MAG: membrane protein [marine bacterium B5-7]
MTSNTQQPRQRDPRLDFFRGMAMLIIFIAHVPNNRFANYIPARFGFSDAAEMFVFLSGMAAAIAFAGTYRRAGFVTGSARIGYRCFQLYATHLGMFFLIATLAAYANTLVEYPNYIGQLNLWRFFQHTEESMIGLFSLTYVPNYFDIMPMYMGVLAMVPLIMLLSRASIRIVPLFCLMLYAAMWLFDLEFLADSMTDRPWFFNPFGWQIIFFTGFCLGTGWIKPPPTSKALLSVAIVFIVACVPFAHYPTWSQVETLGKARAMLEPFWIDKTNLGPLRWLHFMAIVYIMVTLLQGRIWLLSTRIAAPIVKTGQNALPVFFLSMTLSFIAGMILDQIGRSTTSLWFVNGVGISILMLAAYLFGWFKKKPWVRQQAYTQHTSAVSDLTMKHSDATSLKSELLKVKAL